MSNLSNMSLEDILQELTKYGRPHMNQYAVSASFDAEGKRHTAGGSWGCEVNVPSQWLNTDCETRERLRVPVTGWRLSGTGTLRQAAEECLNKCVALAESDLAPYAKFVSEEAVRGK